MTDNLYKILNDIKDIDTFQQAANKYYEDMKQNGFESAETFVAVRVKCPKCGTFAGSIENNEVYTPGMGLMYCEPRECRECGTKIYIDAFIGTRYKKDE